MLPADLAWVEDGERREVAVADLPVDAPLVDIGHAAPRTYAARIAAAGTVFVNGPAGVFEQPETEYGTRALWEAMAAAPGFSALGGGDSVAAMNRFGLAGRFDYVCTAGGAMVQFLSGKPMPVDRGAQGVGRPLRLTAGGGVLKYSIPYGDGALEPCCRTASQVDVIRPGCALGETVAPPASPRDGRAG